MALITHAKHTQTESMMHFVAFFITISVLVMFIGSRQQRAKDKYGIMALVLFTVLAITGTVLLQGTVFFPATAFAMALLVGVHHIIVNFNSEEAPERCSLFQGKQEGSYHEMWIVACVVAGVVSTLRL